MDQVELRVKPVSEEKLDYNLLGFELGAESSQSGFIGIVGRTEYQLRPEFLRDTLSQPLCCLRIEFVGRISETECFTQFILRHARHADNQPTASPVAPLPRPNELIDELPTPQVEIADAEIRSMGNL
jgi:hypothetical protein